MKSFIKKYINKSLLTSVSMALLVAGGSVMTSCSDSFMEDLNTDKTKGSTLDPNAQLTTALLQTYGDFDMMDTYRCYITGFTQYYAGGWNVTYHAGSVYYDNTYASKMWNKLYNVGLKNLVDAIAHTEDLKNLNAALRIHRVYVLSVITDTYGDAPCLEAGKGYLEGISNPKYDKQEDIYNYFFEELAACEAQLGTGTDRISGDVTSLEGDVAAWKRYANSLRMRFAMRISDVAPEKAKAEFEKAVAAGYIADASQDAYVKHVDAPFTLYTGATKLDFRANALGEMLYGQDPTSPTFVSSTLFNEMQNTNDPRLYRICRHYLNAKRKDVQADAEGNVDVTDEFIAYLQRNNLKEQPCNPGQAWYDDWVDAPVNSEIPTLERLVAQNPDAGYDQNNCNVRMMRPFLSIDFEQAQCPGILFTSAEAEFLLAEAATKGWNVQGDAESHYEAGVRASMKLLNDYYLSKNKISDDEINNFIAANKLGSNPKETINTQAWILHLTNPIEGYANLRRSDYPVLQDRSKLSKYDNYNYDENLSTPTRLKYPMLESKYNTANYNEAIERLGGTDDWHKRVWWDTAEINVK